MENTKLLLSGIILALIFAILFIPTTKDFEYTVKFCKDAEINESLMKNLGIREVQVKCNETCEVDFTILDTPYCNANSRNFKVEYTRKNTTLYITSIFSDIMATKCICLAEIKGKISHLPKGEYELVYIFDNRYAKTKKARDETRVSVR